MSHLKTTEMGERKIVLVTGGISRGLFIQLLSLNANPRSTANNGIGFELAGQLTSRPDFHVLLGSRSREKGAKAVQELQSRGLPGSIEAIQLDVTDDESIARAIETVRSRHGRLDALVNNAGISGQNGTSLQQRMHDCFDTNAVGAAVVGDAFAALLLSSKHVPRLLNVSSGSGSISRTLEKPLSAAQSRQTLPYAASKAAMNMVVAHQAVTLGPHVKVFAWCPGFTVSGFSDMNKADLGAKPTAEVAKYGVEILGGKRDSEAGLFLSNEGQYDW